MGNWGLEASAQYGGVMHERQAGWVLFSGIILLIAGIMRFFDGIWALSYHAGLPEHLQGSVFGTNLEEYGIVYLVVAVILFISAWGVFLRSQAARWVGIGAAAVACITSIWWMPYYPIWSLTYIVLGALVIYGLAAHGGPAESTVGERSEHPAS